MVDDILMRSKIPTEPEVEVIYDPLHPKNLVNDIVDAIRLIQKMERGRQGRLRYVQYL